MKLVFGAVICLLTASLPVRISLPDDLATGIYAFRLGIVDPKTGAPGIQFANTGRAEDGRYLISYLEVEQ